MLHIYQQCALVTLPTFPSAFVLLWRLSESSWKYPQQAMSWQSIGTGGASQHNAHDYEIIFLCMSSSSSSTVHPPTTCRTHLPRNGCTVVCTVVGLLLHNGRNKQYISTWYTSFLLNATLPTFSSPFHLVHPTCCIPCANLASP